MTSLCRKIFSSIRFLGVVLGVKTGFMIFNLLNSLFLVGPSFMITGPKGLSASIIFLTSEQFFAFSNSIQPFKMFSWFPRECRKLTCLSCGKNFRNFNYDSPRVSDFSMPLNLSVLAHLLAAGHFLRFSTLRNQKQLFYILIY